MAVPAKSMGKFVAARHNHERSPAQADFPHNGKGMDEEEVFKGQHKMPVNGRPKSHKADARLNGGSTGTAAHHPRGVLDRGDRDKDARSSKTGAGSASLDGSENSNTSRGNNLYSQQIKQIVQPRAPAMVDWAYELNVTGDESSYPTTTASPPASMVSNSKIPAGMTPDANSPPQRHDIGAASRSGLGSESTEMSESDNDGDADSNRSTHQSSGVNHDNELPDLNFADDRNPLRARASKVREWQPQGNGLVAPQASAIPSTEDCRRGKRTPLAMHPPPAPISKENSVKHQHPQRPFTHDFVQPQVGEGSTHGEGEDAVSDSEGEEPDYLPAAFRDDTDFPEAQTKEMDFMQLQSAHFDVPDKYRTEDTILVSTDEQLHDALAKLVHSNKREQQKFLYTLTTEQFEAAGKWFTQEHDNTTARVTKLRQQKRKDATAFEERLRSHHLAIEERTQEIRQRLHRLRSAGDDLFTPTTLGIKRTIADTQSG